MVPLKVRLGEPMRLLGTQSMREGVAYRNMGVHEAATLENLHPAWDDGFSMATQEEPLL